MGFDFGERTYSEIHNSIFGVHYSIVTQPRSRTVLVLVIVFYLSLRHGDTEKNNRQKLRELRGSVRDNLSFDLTGRYE